MTFTELQARALTEPEKHSTAIHEAGHAVIGHYYKMSVHGISLKRQLTPEGMLLGWAEIAVGISARAFVKVRGTDSYRDQKPEELKRKLLFKHAVLLVGGMMAVQLHNCLTKDGLPNLGSDSDQDSLVTIYQDLGLSVPQAELYLRRVSNRCQDILVPRMDLVKRLATILLERESLTDTEVLRVFRK